MKNGETFEAAIYNSIKNDDLEDTGLYDANELNNSALLDRYEYVVYGKVFRVVEEKDSQNLNVFASFGGLMMSLKGKKSSLKTIPNESRIYLLIKKC